MTYHGYSITQEGKVLKAWKQAKRHRCLLHAQARGSPNEYRSRDRPQIRQERDNSSQRQQSGDVESRPPPR